LRFLGAVFAEAIARGVVSGSERRRRKAIEKLHDHAIICGYGRVGQRTADEFHSAGASVPS
jgi:voltage-gated potassium channel Kch